MRINTGSLISLSFKLGYNNFFSLSMKYFIILNTAWKVSVFGVMLIRISPHTNWIRRIRSISPYSVQTRENAGQNKSEYGHFLRSASSRVECTKSHVNWQFIKSFAADIWMLVTCKILRSKYNWSIFCGYLETFLGWVYWNW